MKVWRAADTPEGHYWFIDREDANRLLLNPAFGGSHLYEAEIDESNIWDIRRDDSNILKEVFGWSKKVLCSNGDTARLEYLTNSPQYKHLQYDKSIGVHIFETCTTQETDTLIWMASNPRVLRELQERNKAALLYIDDFPIRASVVYLPEGLVGSQVGINEEKKETKREGIL